MLSGLSIFTCGCFDAFCIFLEIQFESAAARRSGESAEAFTSKPTPPEYAGMGHDFPLQKKKKEKKMNAQTGCIIRSKHKETVELHSDSSRLALFERVTCMQMIRFLVHRKERGGKKKKILLEFTDAIVWF